MTLKETARICATIRNATFAWRNQNEAEFTETIKGWYECLKDEPFDMGMSAAIEYIRQNSYPPTVADVYRPYKEYKDQLKADKREAINIYYRAIANYPCYEDTPEIQSEYMRIIGKTPDPDKARRFETRLIAFVRKHEESKEPIPPLIKYLKGVKQIE